MAVVSGQYDQREIFGQCLKLLESRPTGASIRIARPLFMQLFNGISLGTALDRLLQKPGEDVLGLALKELATAAGLAVKTKSFAERPLPSSHFLPLVRAAKTLFDGRTLSDVTRVSGLTNAVLNKYYDLKNYKPSKSNRTAEASITGREVSERREQLSETSTPVVTALSKSNQDEASQSEDPFPIWYNADQRRYLAHGPSEVTVMFRSFTGDPGWDAYLMISAQNAQREVLQPSGYEINLFGYHEAKRLAETGRLRTVKIQFGESADNG